MFRTIVVTDRGTFLGKRGERLLLRRPTKARPAAAPEAQSLPGGDGGAVSEAPSEGALSSPPPRTPHRARGGEAHAEPEGRARTEEEIPLFRVGEIVLPSRGVSVSTDLIEEAAMRGIPITFTGASGQPYAMITSPMLTATIATRRAQLRAMDRAEGATLARAFVAGKLRNQASLLVYFAKAEKGEADRRSRALAAAMEVRKARKLALGVEGAHPDAVRESLLGAEGLGARAYWSGVRALLEGHCAFEGRRGRGAIDPVNALLNYGYGIMASRAWAALLHAGLDPFAGMLHADRSGKPSLVLDLMEELRAPAVDRAVLAHVRLGQPVRFEGTFLDEPTRKAIAAAVLERLEAPVSLSGQKIQLGSVIQRQARAVATHVRKEGEYKSFAMTW
jgi:CRISPR-associated protein Cas1